MLETTICYDSLNYGVFNLVLVVWGFQTWLVMWRVCTPQYKNVYRVNHTTGSLVQDIFTNTIEHFELKFVQPDL